MTWYEDLRHIDWNEGRYTILDKVKEGGRTYLGLAAYAEVAEVAQAMDAGQRRPLPSTLTWVEERDGGFLALSRKEVDTLLKRKSERAAEAFRRT